MTWTFLKVHQQSQTGFPKIGLKKLRLGQPMSHQELHQIFPAK